MINFLQCQLSSRIKLFEDEGYDDGSGASYRVPELNPHAPTFVPISGEPFAPLTLNGLHPSGSPLVNAHALNQQENCFNPEVSLHL